MGDVSKSHDALRIGIYQRSQVAARTTSPHANDVQRRMCHACTAVSHVDLLHSFCLVLGLVN